MEVRAEEFRDAYGRVKAEIAKVIVGHEEIVHGVLTRISSAGTPCWKECRARARRSWCGPWPMRRRWTSTGFSSRPT